MQDIPKRRGRPPKNPNKPPLTEKQTAELVAKKKQPKAPPVPGAPQSLEKYSKASSEEVCDMMKSVLRWYGRPAVKTNEEVAQRLNEFFRTISETGELPSVEKMALALGVTVRAVEYWQNGSKCDAERTAMIKQAKQVLAAMDAELVSQGKIPQVTYIFRAKNFFGMKDQTDVVVTPNNPLGDAASNEELLEKYQQYAELDEPPALPEATE